MMSPEWAATLARYNRWMNDKLYALVATLEEEDRKRDMGAFFESIHGTLNHLLVADQIWLARFEGLSLPDGQMAPGVTSLDQELHTGFEALRDDRRRTDERLSSWVAELTPERLAGPLVVVRRGARQQSPLWQSVAHVFNHQTHHRGQITTLLTQQGHDIGVTDLVAMLRLEATR